MDPYDLERFVEAQKQVYPNAVRELQAGRKTSHWMWFIFPQLRALGLSPTSIHYGISSLDEAGAYLKHPVLGPRLLDCAKLVTYSPTPTAHQLMGEVDAVKLRSSATLFALLDPQPFKRVLVKYYDGQPDRATLKILKSPMKVATLPSQS